MSTLKQLYILYLPNIIRIILFLRLKDLFIKYNKYDLKNKKNYY